MKDWRNRAPIKCRGIELSLFCFLCWLFIAFSSLLTSQKAISYLSPPLRPPASLLHPALRPQSQMMILLYRLPRKWESSDSDSSIFSLLQLPATLTCTLFLFLPSWYQRTSPASSKGQGLCCLDLSPLIWPASSLLLCSSSIHVSMPPAHQCF